MTTSHTIDTKLATLFIAPSTPYHAYPFDQVAEADLRTAMERAIELHREEVDAIANNPEPPTFANTILALEQSGEAIEAVAGLFYNILHANATDTLLEMADYFAPLLSQLSSHISLNKKLFERISTLYNRRDTLALDSIDQRLLYQAYTGFVRSGAQLNTTDANRYRELSERLSTLAIAFAKHKLADEQSWDMFLPLHTPSLSALPKAILEDAAQAAVKSNKYEQEGYLFSLAAPHYSAIMRFCSDPQIREQFYRAKMAVGYQDNDNNNCSIIKQLVNARLELAQLLGYDSFAHYALHERMLHTPKQVLDMLEQLKTNYIPLAQKEWKELEEFAGKPLQNHDIAYYMERYQETTFGLKEEELRPYFPLQKVVKGVLQIATNLYGVTFSRRTDLPLYHPDVQCYEVLDPTYGFMGLLYLDFFPRKGKQSGAWMNNLRDMTPTQRPHVVLVMNFTPPTSTSPALLTPGEVHTFLHEFGHALHGLLTRAKYASLSGTNVKRDFVELPSQFMENFLLQPSVMQGLLSAHYQTGDPLPQELLDKLKKAARHGAGYSTVRQLSFGLLDMAYHTQTSPLGDDFEPKAFEDAACQSVQITPPSPVGCCTSTSFGHIFSGGYAAGYYGYKWSEILDADAFELFKQEGLWNREIAHRFRKYILESGDQAHPMELYKQFRGREPRIDALLKRDFPKE